MHSRSVSNSGWTAGISVCITKGTILKEIRVNLFYMNKCIFANQRFNTFWAHHVLLCQLLRVKLSYGILSNLLLIISFILQYITFALSVHIICFQHKMWYM
jgi:hypothetical protein